MDNWCSYSDRWCKLLFDNIYCQFNDDSKSKIILYNWQNLVLFKLFLKEHHAYIIEWL